MTRKVVVDLIDAVGTFMSKTNQMSDYIGDLDNLNPTFDSNFADSSIVSAINLLSEQFDSITSVLFGGTQTDLRVGNFVGDSATITTLRVGQLMADSADIDSASISNLAVGGITVDSARFRNDFRVDSIGLYDNGSLFIDSATISNVTITNLTLDSARVNKLTANQATITNATIDSATITNLNVSNLEVDSAHFNVLSADSGFMNDLVVDSANVNNLSTRNIIMSGQNLDNLKRFTVKGENGTIIIDGYMLSTSNNPSTL